MWGHRSLAVMKRVGLTIDCAEPAALVDFWCAALGYIPEPAPDGHRTWLDYWRSRGIPESELDGAGEQPESIVDPDGVRPRIWFQCVAEPKVAKNRVHLDVDVTDGRQGTVADRRDRVKAEAARLEALGARQLRTLAPEGADYFAIVMADPEGNEFCLS